MAHRETAPGRTPRKGRTAAAGPPRPAATTARPAFLSLSTGPGPATSTPIMYANNPVGDALLSTGIASLASSVVTAMGPLLPVGLSGLDVRETLHRLDANTHAPTLDRGLTSANRIGEALAAISMRWHFPPICSSAPCRRHSRCFARRARSSRPC